MAVAVFALVALLKILEERLASCVDHSRRLHGRSKQRAVWAERSTTIQGREVCGETLELSRSCGLVIHQDVDKLLGISLEQRFG